jgi:mono/diheme cytochrome c family protein
MNLKLASLLLTAFFTITIYAAPPVEEGKSIFQARCAACHNIHKTMTGPALAGVDQRRSMDWIINFVHSSQSVIKSGDKEAIALFEQYKNIPMPDHQDLSDSQIKNVVAYIKTEASVGKKEATDKKTVQKTKTILPFVVNNYGYMLSLFAVFTLLIGVIIFAVQVNNYKRNYFRKQ